MLKIFLSLAICMACLSPNARSQDIGDYFRENVALIDFRIRSINQLQFVREILVVDFDGSQALPDSLAFEQEGFADNGAGYDNVAGDGIYTTTSVFSHTESLPYDAQNLLRSVSDNTVTDEGFLWEEDLEDYLSNYTLRAGPILRIRCEVEWCVCGTTCGGCIVKWGGSWACVDCPKFKSCSIEVGWS